MTKDQWILVIASFGSALLGSLIGGGFAILGSYLTHRSNITLELLKRRQEIDGILQSITSELKILDTLFLAQAGGWINELASDQPLMMQISITQKYFIVYPENTTVVGQIQDVQLVDSIIVTYNKAAFFIELLEINNWFYNQIDEYNQTLDELEASGGASATTNYRLARNPKNSKLLNDMTVHGQVLKSTYLDFQKQTKSLIAEIDTYRSKHRFKT